MRPTATHHRRLQRPARVLATAMPQGRRAVASLDYVLVLGVILPSIAFLMWAGPRMIRLAYEMLCVLVSWPFV